VKLVLFVVLLAGNGFFVAAEFALVSARRSALETRAATGSKAARLALRGMERISLMLAGAQLGVTLCSVGLGALAEPILAHALGPVFADIGAGRTLDDVVSFALALAIVAFLHVVLGELVPKNFAMASPERAASTVGAAMVAIVTVIAPVLWVVNSLANLATRALGFSPKSEVTSAFTPEEVAGMVAESRREGLLEPEEEALLAGALHFAELRVGALARAGADMVTVAAGASPEQIEALSAQTGYSRFPVTGSRGELVGYVHLKDVLETDPHRRATPVAPTVFRTLATVAAGDDLSTAFATMQRARAHLAQVVGTGEAGTQQPAAAAAGVGWRIVALEDVVSQLVSAGVEGQPAGVGR
jgi:CBS domain containing-hemolysin-like protein